MADKVKVKFLKEHLIFTPKGIEKQEAGSTGEVTAKQFASLGDRVELVLTPAEKKKKEAAEKAAIEKATTPQK